MKNINIFIIIFLLLSSSISFSDDGSFNDWKISFKKYALAQNISEETFNKVMKNARFLPKVIEYDRYQPEFYEDTNTYVSKRASDNKLKKGLNFYNKNKILIDKIEKEFKVEQELLLALMGIETNYGTYVGKMDIISSQRL